MRSFYVEVLSSLRPWYATEIDVLVVAWKTYKGEADMQQAPRPSLWQILTASRAVPERAWSPLWYLTRPHQTVELCELITEFVVFGSCICAVTIDMNKKKGQTVTPWRFQFSLIDSWPSSPPPNLSVCVSTRLQTLVFPPGWLRVKARP
jgi:hypothetical protein